MFPVRATLVIAIALAVQTTTLAEKKAEIHAKKEEKVERRSVSAKVDNAVGKGVGIRADQGEEVFIPKDNPSAQPRLHHRRRLHLSRHRLLRRTGPHAQHRRLAKRRA
jgi:hypothetical protein